jgi:hypothetical protein
LPVDNGPADDDFFLTFEKIGSNVSTRPATITPPPPAPVDLPEASKIGVRTFDEINGAMSEITGVSELNGNVSSTYAQVRQSLPTVPQMGTVLASHQVAIAQLAIEYCNAAVENTTVRDALWSASFNGWNLAPASQSPGWENALAKPLLDKLVGLPQIDTQPDRALIEQEIYELINGIPGDPSRLGLAATNSNQVQRTAIIGKSVCSAILGSAAMLVK